MTRAARLLVRRRIRDETDQTVQKYRRGEPLD
jgi:hypothetical protein